MSTNTFTSEPIASQGQQTSAQSIPVVIASDQSTIPISGTITVTEASIGPTGSPVPASANYVAGKNVGNLIGLAVDGSGNIVVSSIVAALPAGSNAIGTVTVGNASLAVTGTFWQATQPVSAASLPLPTGAATLAKQPALGTAGTASADVLTVQGIASMTALKVDGSAVTQPVSGNLTTVSTVTAVTAITNALPAGSNSIGTVVLGAGANAVGSVSVTGTTTISGTVTANAGTGTLTTDQTTASATFQAEANVVAASITSSFVTLFTTGGVMKWIGMRNNTNQPVAFSLDGGTTTHFILDSGDQVSLDLKSLGLSIANSTALQVKYTGSAPTTGSARINGAR